MIVRLIADLLAPLLLAITDRDDLEVLLSDLGVSIGDGFPEDPLEQWRDVFPVDAVEQLMDLIGPVLDDPEVDLDAATIAAAINAADGLLGQLRDLPSPAPVAVSWLDADEYRAALENLPGYLVYRWIETLSPIVAALLDLAGTVALIPASGRRVLDREAVGALFADPLGHGEQTYLSGGRLSAEPLLSRLLTVAQAAGMALTRDGDAGATVAVHDPSGRGSVQVHLAAQESDLTLVANVVGEPRTTFMVSDRLGVTVEADRSTLPGASLRVSGDGEVEVVSAAGTTHLTARAAFSSEERPWDLIGTRPGTRIEVAAIAYEAGLRLGTEAGMHVLLEVPPEGMALIIEPGDADSFLGSVLGETSIQVPFGVVIGYDSATGLTLSGGVGLAFSVPLALRLGPIEVPGLDVQATIDASALVVRATADVVGSIGPLSVSVSGIGAGARIDLAAGTAPRLGFEPPTGIGIGIDLGVAKGGGFLNIRPDEGRYDGAIELDVLSVGISAFVIVETDRPGLDGWSMMMALYLQIPAVQLGFGFTLSGVGGLAGINRGIDADALGDSVRSGSLDAVLFPDDPIAQAPLIIEALSAIFPAADGQYVFGPVVKIGWGTPTLVEMSVGVVIELPDPIRIAVLGSITAILPRPEVPLVELHLDVAGVADFQAGTLAVDASLHHSTIVGFSVAGDMALRASFQGAPTLLLALGGFHPDFEPPTGFPRLARLSVGLDSGPLFRISFDCYLAITSNTVQFGAAFEIVAEVSGFGIEGGAEFDALIAFNPFALTTSIGVHISVRAAGVDLMGVWLSGRLQGPNPWHVTGSAEFKVLGVKKEVSVDEIIGSRTVEVAPATPDLLQMVVDALALDEAWAAAASSADGVTVCAPEGFAVLTVAPHASLEVGQNIVPLGQPLEKYGNAEQLAHVEFRLLPIGGLEATGAVRDWFSPGQFTRLKPKERLAAPSFELMDAGIAFGAGSQCGPSSPAQLGRESILVDTDLEAFEESSEPAPAGRRLVERPAGPLLSATSGHAFDVPGAGSFAVVEPTYGVADAVTGAVTKQGTFLTASANLQKGQVLVMRGENRR